MHVHELPAHSRADREEEYEFAWHFRYVNTLSYYDFKINFIYYYFYIVFSIFVPIIVLTHFIQFIVLIK